MIIDELFEGPQLCPECGGISFSDLILAEKKDACYYKVKASAKVWPSAYASGRLVQCRKKGAANYGKSKTEGVAQGLNEFSPGSGGDDDHQDPYGTPKPEHYDRSIDFFGQFEADHFDDEDMNDVTGVFKGYWLDRDAPNGRTQIAYFKFDNPRRTGSDDPGVGWYYEPESDGNSKITSAEPYVDNSNDREQQELSMIKAFLKSGQKPNPGSQIYNLMKRHGMAEQQELDEKWSQKYKKSINCSNPKGFSQKAHCAGRKKNEDVAEGTGQPLSVQQLATISDAALDAAYGYGRSTPGNTFGWQANLKSAAYAKQMIDRGVTDIEAISDAIHKGWNTTAQAFVQDPEQFDDTAKLAAAGKLEAKLQQRAQLMKQNYAQLPEEEKEKDRVVARALLQAIRGEQSGIDETRVGQVPMTLKPGETDNLEPEDIAGFRKLPAYKQGQVAQQQAGQQLIQKSPYTFQSDQDWAYRQGAFDTQQAATSARFAKLSPLTTEGEQQKGADYRDPKEVDYDDEYDAMVARVKKLAGLGPMKTVYDPTKRVYRNMPTAVQPKK